MVAYRRTSGHCQRCFEPFAPGQAVILVRERLIAEDLVATCIYTTEWVSVCDGCAKSAELAAAMHEEYCRGCMQPMRLPKRRRARLLVCSSRCAQRVQRRNRRRRSLIQCKGCSAPFLPKRRRDARFCSPACRQKAYRGRWNGGPACNPDPLEVDLVLDKLARALESSGMQRKDP